MPNARQSTIECQVSLKKACIISFWFASSHRCHNRVQHYSIRTFHEIEVLSTELLYRKVHRVFEKTPVVGQLIIMFYSSLLTVATTRYCTRGVVACLWRWCRRCCCTCCHWRYRGLTYWSQLLTFGHTWVWRGFQSNKPTGWKTRILYEVSD